MKHLILTTCVLGLVGVAVSAYVLPEEEANIDAKFDAQSQMIAEEALLVGEILQTVSKELKQDHLLLYNESEEYILGLIWDKTKAILNHAGGQLKVGGKSIAKEAKKQIKEAVKKAQRKASDQATILLSKILSNTFQGYDLNEYETRVDFVKALCSRIDSVALRLTELGNTFRVQ
ncbi:uncharacterized protein LOC144169461 isoform X2 [Haemaphysalis longicornis]